MHTNVFENPSLCMKIIRVTQRKGIHKHLSQKHTGQFRQSPVSVLLWDQPDAAENQNVETWIVTASR